MPQHKMMLGVPLDFEKNISVPKVEKVAEHFSRSTFSKLVCRDPVRGSGGPTVRKMLDILYFALSWVSSSFFLVDTQLKRWDTV